MESESEITPAVPTLVPDIGKLPAQEPEDGVFDAYANAIFLNWTLYDARIRFGELVQVSKTDSIPSWSNQEGVLLERAAITIPLYMAKHLRDLLNTMVTQYEEKNGELKQPRNF